MDDPTFSCLGVAHARVMSVYEAFEVDHIEEVRPCKTVTQERRDPWKTRKRKKKSKRKKQRRSCLFARTPRVLSRLEPKAMTNPVTIPVEDSNIPQFVGREHLMLDFFLPFS